jgi:hypothetical protein
MTLTAISHHDLECAPSVRQRGREQPNPRQGFSDSWFEFRVRIYMYLFMLDRIRQGRRKGQ